MTNSISENSPQGGQSDHTLRQLAQLEAHDLTDHNELPRLQQVAERYSVAITPSVLKLIDAADPNDPIKRQFVPTTAELETNPQEFDDPVGDRPHSPVRGIVHRYRDRLLLMPLTLCPVYCRFCFRRETVGPDASAMLTDAELDTALDYIRNNKQIWEVILSGGDPLMLSPRRLQKIVCALDSIEHVRVVRIHSRVPVVEPERISGALVNSLRISKAVYLVLHTNHVRELSHSALDACARIVDAGIPMLSQTVLLRGVNDRVETLEALLRALVENRIKPYYLHHADRAPGTAHFRTRIADGQALLRALRGRVSGLCQPDYVLDIPGGHGKVPVGPVWAEAGPNGYTVQDPSGTPHQYADPAPD